MSDLTNETFEDGVEVNPPIRPGYHQREPQMVPCVIARCCGESGHDYGCCIHKEAPAAFESVRMIREEAEQRAEPERSEILRIADRIEEIFNAG